MQEATRIEAEQNIGMAQTLWFGALTMKSAEVEQLKCDCEYLTAENQMLEAQVGQYKHELSTMLEEKDSLKQ